MIPEPFTYIAAGFGIAMTLLSAAASTVESAKQRIDKFREYEDRLRQMGADILASDAEFESCLAEWRDDRKRLKSLEDCAQLFGDARRRDLEEKMFQVLNALANVQQVLVLRFAHATNGGGALSENLELSAGPVVEEAWKWMQHVAHKPLFVNASEHKSWTRLVNRSSRKYGLYLRTTFTIYDGERIKTRTERLQKAVSDFCKFTQHLSKSLPPLSIGLHATFADRVSHLIQLNQEWSNLSEVMSTLSGSPFAVLPRPPDSEGQIDCLCEGLDITTSMLVDDVDDEGKLIEKRVVHVSYLSVLTFPQRDRRMRAIRGHCKSEAINRIG